MKEIKVKKEKSELEVVEEELRKAYARKANIRKEIYAEYVGKAYYINGVFYFVDRVLERDFSLLVIDDSSIRMDVMDVPLDQWGDYEWDKKEFIKVLESRVDVFLSTINDR